MKNSQVKIVTSDMLEKKRYVTIHSKNDVIISCYCINTTKYWLRAIFKENKLASSPLILHKANILWY